MARKKPWIIFTGHPIQEYEQELRQFAAPPERFKGSQGSAMDCRHGGNVRMTKSRRGVPTCFVQLDDRSARIEVSDG